MRYLIILLLPSIGYAGEIEDLYCEYPEAGMVRVYSAPIRYYDEQGTPQPISDELVADGDGWKNETNVIKSYVTKRGRITYTRGNHSAWIEPRYLSVDVVPEQNRISQFQRTLDVIKTHRNRARIANVAPQVDIAWEVRGATIKEEIVLKSANVLDAIPAKASQLLMAWDYELPQIESGSIEDNHVIVRAPNGDVVLRILPVVVEDSTGAQTIGQYSIRNGYLLATMDLDWFRDAEREWPIVIDPTVDSGTTTAERRLLDFGGGLTDAVYLKFPLPDLAGGTITDADLKLYCTSFSPGDPVNPPSYYWIWTHTSRDTSWDESSSAATLQALAKSTGQVAGSLASFTASAWTTFSVFETGTNSIVAAYDASETAITVILDMAGTSGFAITDTDTILLSAESSEISALFAADDYSGGSSYYPYIEITYEAAPTGPGGKRHSGTTGVMIF